MLNKNLLKQITAATIIGVSISAVGTMPVMGTSVTTSSKFVQGQRVYIKEDARAYRDAYSATTNKNYGFVTYRAQNAYYVYREVPGSVNITRVKGVPGGWVKTDVVSAVDPTATPAPVKPTPAKPTPAPAPAPVKPAPAKPAPTPVKPAPAPAPTPVKPAPDKDVSPIVRGNVPEQFNKLAQGMAVRIGNDVKAYTNADLAKAGKSEGYTKYSSSKVYYIYKQVAGSTNITTTPGVPGGWISVKEVSSYVVNGITFAGEEKAPTPVKPTPAPAKPTPAPAPVKPAPAKPVPTPGKPAPAPAPTPVKPAPAPAPTPVKPEPAKPVPTPEKPIIIERGSTGIVNDEDVDRVTPVGYKWTLPEGVGKRKSYERYFMIKTVTTSQYKLQNDLLTKTGENGLRYYRGLPLIAVSLNYGNVGDVIMVTLSSGQQVKAVIGDIKAVASDYYNYKRYHDFTYDEAVKWGIHNDGSVLEFIVDPDFIDQRTRLTGSVEHLFVGDVISIQRMH